MRKKHQRRRSKVSGAYIRKCNILDEMQKELNNSADLKDCPWCGVRPILKHTHPGTGWIQCDCCGAQGPDVYDSRAWRKVFQRAIDRWNNGAFE